MSPTVRKLIVHGALLWPALLVAGLLVAQIVPCFYMSADSAAYVELARNLALGRGYTFNGEPFFGYPPVFPELLAGGILVFGNHIVVMRAIVVLSALGFLVASFFVAKRFVGSRAALLVVWLFGLSVALADWTTYIMSDLPGAMLAIVALLAILRAERVDQSQGRFGRATLLALMLTVLAVMTRMANVAVVAAVVLSYFVLRRDRFSRGTVRTMLPLVLVVLACVSLWLVLRLTSRAAFQQMPFLPLLESHKDWDSGYLGPIGVLARAVRNAPLCLRSCPGVLMAGTRSAADGLRWVLVALSLLGLGVGFVRRRGLIEAFTLIVLVLPWATPFTGQGSRYYLAIGPLAFMYAYEAVAWLVGLAGRLRPRARAAVGSVAGVLLLLFVVLILVGVGPLDGAWPWFGDWRRALVAVAFAGSMLVGLLGARSLSLHRLLPAGAGALLLAVWAVIQLGIVVPRVSELRTAQRGHDMVYRHAEIAEIADELRALAEPGDACVSSEPRLYRGLTGLRAYRFPLTRHRDGVLDAFEMGRWIIIDLKRPEDVMFAVPVIDTNPDLFGLAAENDRMRLYRRLNRAGETRKTLGFP